MAQLAGGQNTPAAAMPRDAEMGQMLEKAAMEAQDQMHHHASQLRMWERVSQAARAGLEMLSADEQMTSDEGPMEKQSFNTRAGY